MGQLFTPTQMSLAAESFSGAEALASRYYGMTRSQLKEHRYDIKTLADLAEHEVNEGAFAHLCKYEVQTDAKVADENNSSYCFYRICLQDNRILDAVARGSSFIKLAPLLLYIAAHELVHVIRFDHGEIAFDASPAEKEQEEETVHTITRQMLAPVSGSELRLIVECFSEKYRLGDFV